LRGFRRGVWGEDFNGHDESSNLWASERWLACRFDARRLVFIDESSTLESACAKRREAYGKMSRNRGKNQTLLASITLEGGMGKAMTI